MIWNMGWAGWKSARITRSRHKICSVLALLVVLSLLFAGVARGDGEEVNPVMTGGDTPQVELEAQVGWQGRGMAGKTVPAVITIRNNTSQDLFGVIEVVNYNKMYASWTKPIMSTQASSPPPIFVPAAAFGQRLSLPAGSEKRVTLWFPLTSPERMLFRFREGDQVLGSAFTSLNIPDYGGYQLQTLGVLGRIPPAVERIKLVTPDGVPRTPIIFPLSVQSDLNPDEESSATLLLPDMGDGLEACGIILVAGFDGHTLEPGQKETLADWLRLGGHLVVAGGATVRQTLAVLPEGEQLIRAGDFLTRSDWQTAFQWLGINPETASPAITASLQGEGAMPLGPEDDPLGMEVKVGDGLLTVLAFDPAGEPWQTGPLGQAFWKKLLGAESNNDFASKFRSVSNPSSDIYLNSVLGMTGSLPADTFPRWWVVGTFLLVFAAVSGPATYWVLRRRRRPEFAWLAVPLLALVFAGSAYAYMLWSGGNLIVNSIQVADTRLEGRVNGYTAIGFFSPTSAVFTASMTDPGGLAQVQVFGPSPDLSQDFSGKEPPYYLLRGGDLGLRCGPDSRWNMRSLSFRQDLNQASGLHSHLQVEGTTVTGTIRNETALHLDHIALMLGDSCRVIPALAPGEEASISLDIPAPAVNYLPQGEPQRQYPVSWSIFLPTSDQPAVSVAPASAMVDYAYSQPLPSLKPDDYRRINLLERWPNTYQTNNIFGGQVRPLTLVAWSSEPLAPLSLDGISGRRGYLSMILQRPDLDLAPGPFRLPPGLVLPEVTEAQITSTGGRNNVLAITGAGGYLVYSFQPRLAAGTELNSVTVTFPFFPVQQPPGVPKDYMGEPAGSPSAVAPGALEIYNAAQKRWEGLSGATSFTVGGEYAGLGGEVRLRINGAPPDSGQAFFFLPPSVAYEGVAG